jgi:ABC-type multidrug transport system ATPase subunit
LTVRAGERVALLGRNGMAILLVDKNVAEVARLADWHYVLEKGRVVWSGSSAALIDLPANRQRSTTGYSGQGAYDRRECSAELGAERCYRSNYDDCDKARDQAVFERGHPTPIVGKGQ